MIDVHAIPLFKAILGNVEIIPVPLRECGWLRVVLFVEDAGEKVVFELRDKVLGGY